uniref:EamA domain-containing protein n=1 Tax=Kalanchoe fedtschenkoi TaxID=63787 RepID=A0A7N0ZZ95_KALFE
MKSEVWRWILGLIYIVLVASIWIAASFVVQTVVDEGVSPFLITYICNSLFIVYIPLFEIGRYLEDSYGGLFFWKYKESERLEEQANAENVILLGEGSTENEHNLSAVTEDEEVGQDEKDVDLDTEIGLGEQGMSSSGALRVIEDADIQLDSKGRWTRARVAKVSLLISPFWFLAQLTFNLSLKYTTVTSNTILSSASSLFTFLVSLAFLGEKFTWIKLVSVLLCMLGTIIVSLGDSESVLSANASNPLWGDILALVSAGLYAVYITLIRKKLPDDDGKSGQASMAQFLGYLGFFNLLLFLPIALILNFTHLESFNALTWKQFGLVVGKGLLDNVLSDYLWAKAVLLTTTTVATAGLTIQVPLAAIVDYIIGNAPNLLDYIGAAAITLGFVGINIPADTFSKSTEGQIELETEDQSAASTQHHNTPTQGTAAS